MRETDHTSWMLTSLLLWLCALPLVGLAILPWLGMKAAVIVAAALLVASVTACYGICIWQTLGQSEEHVSSLGRPAAIGVAGGLALVGLYLTIVRLGSASWAHTVELLLTDWYFVATVATGFGIQIGLFTHLRRLLRRNGRVRSAAAMAAGGTATSTTSMVACCLHHLADVLPVIGLSGAAVLFTTYKVPVILFGLTTNALGIGMMVRTIRHHRAVTSSRPLDRIMRAHVDHRGGNPT